MRTDLLLALRKSPPRATDGGVCWSRGGRWGVKEADRLFHLWHEFWSFLAAEGLEPTNNRAEQALRPAVIRRKLCFGSQSGSRLRTTERLLSITHTCRQHQRNLLDFLTEAISAHRQGNAPPVPLPAN